MSDGNTFGASGMHEAEADDPGVVYRHGWTHLECGDCADVIYDGRWIDADAHSRIRAAHEAACSAPVSSMAPYPSLWRRLFRGTTP